MGFLNVIVTILWFLCSIHLETIRWIILKKNLNLYIAYINIMSLVQ